MTSGPIHRLYFSPGMFGFGQLASYDYFAHLERALTARFFTRGLRVETFVLDVPPTASLRRRAVRLAELVRRTSGHESGDSGPIHVIGHSTGGLDARLLASPGANLPIDPESLAWLPRLRTVTTLNAPHYGTPLASFFTTVSGQRMLYALSALTFIALSLGAPPMSVASAMVMAIGRLDEALGIQVRLLDRATDALLRVLDDARSREVRAYLGAIKEDQGAMVQLTPEAMDIFRSAVANRPGVYYQCACSMAPPPSARRVVRGLVRPWHVLSATLFTMIQTLTARYDGRYPCAIDPAQASAADEASLVRAFGKAPGPRANDGVVPLRSQIWGELVWAGYGDHLDVLGHFNDPAHGGHVDWMRSGSNFDRARFDRLCDAISAGIFRALDRDGR